MIRYISWAIPSIGFIGTVRGIGEALAQADKAVQGDIAGVTQSLGVAFNSTFIALLISIFSHVPGPPAAVVAGTTRVRQRELCQ